MLCDWNVVQEDGVTALHLEGTQRKGSCLQFGGGGEMNASLFYALLVFTV